jgi:hypothetical protein
MKFADSELFLNLQPNSLTMRPELYPSSGHPDTTMVSKTLNTARRRKSVGFFFGLLFQNCFRKS